MSAVYEVKFHTQALQDIQTIKSYLEHEFGAQDAARRLVTGILETAEALSTLPRRNRVIAASGAKEIRRARHGNYWLLYEIQASTVHILAVLYAKRDLTARLSSLLSEPC